MGPVVLNAPPICRSEVPVKKADVHPHRKSGNAESEVKESTDRGARGSKIGCLGGPAQRTRMEHKHQNSQSQGGGTGPKAKRTEKTPFHDKWAVQQM